MKQISIDNGAHFITVGRGKSKEILIYKILDLQPTPIFTVDELRNKTLTTLDMLYRLFSKKET